MGDDEVQSKPRDFWARWAFERLQVLQPHVDTTGIFEHAGCSYIVCPRLEPASRAADGTPIREWFDSNCRPVGIPMQLVPEPPAGSQQIPARTLEEAIELAGDPLTSWEVFSELSLRLPGTFPLVGVEDATSPMVVKICVSRDLSAEEMRELDGAVASLQQPWRSEVTVRSGATAGGSSSLRTLPARSDGLPPLRPSRLIFGSTSSRVRALCEEDEDFWATNRAKVLGSWTSDSRKLIPGPEWDDSVSRCLLFAHDPGVLPIVNPLSLFRRVALILAPNTGVEEICSRLRCTKSELLELMELGRVQLVLPHSLDNYLPDLLEPAVERAAGQILFPRRVAALVVADARRRLPFLFAPLTAAQRAIIIRALRQVSETADDPAKSILERAAGALADSWCRMYPLVNGYGSLGASIVGLGGLMGTIFREGGPANREVEFLHAGLVVQWAAGLNALAFPTALTSNPFVEILATVYSGAPVKSVPEFASKLEILARGLLTVDGGVSPVELARSLGTGDVDRFRSLVDDVLRANSDPEAIRGVVERFNAAVTVYEARSASFRKLEVLALLAALAAELTKVHWIDLSRWLASQLLRKLQEYRAGNAVVGSVVDALDGMVKLSPPPAVLVARMQAAVTKARTASAR